MNFEIYNKGEVPPKYSNIFRSIDNFLIDNGLINKNIKFNNDYIYTKKEFKEFVNELMLWFGEFQQEIYEYDFNEKYLVKLIINTNGKIYTIYIYFAKQNKKYSLDEIQINKFF